MAGGTLCLTGCCSWGICFPPPDGIPRSRAVSPRIWLLQHMGAEHMQQKHSKGQPSSSSHSVSPDVRYLHEGPGLDDQ